MSSDRPEPDPALVQEALSRFDAENAGDPHQEADSGQWLPRELLYARRLTGWVLRLCPDASAELVLAARCQHLRRWEIPRNSYPLTRPGYLKWREDLKQFHARRAGEILRDTGLPQPVIDRVQQLVLKRLFPHDPESRILEDALCLVFLEFQLAELASKTPGEKVLTALKKSWGKMSEAGRAEALKLNLPPREAALLKRALEEPV
ncbi:MAG: DUF4202 domain-containing protein [Verrucomicrobiota bacterium]